MNKIRTMFAVLSLIAVFSVVGNSQASAQTPPADATAAPATVVVQPGDSLSKIATVYETTYVRLYDANAQIANPDVIHPGENIRVPAATEQIPSRQLPQAPVAKPAAPRAVTQRRAQAATPASAPASGDAWGQLAKCESGGNPTTNTGNGYYGAYQFSASTWRSVGGSGLPSQASMEEQTARAQALQARSGWGQWPACTSKLGLR